MLGMFAVYFGGFETMGVRRYNDMIPLTWVLRCIPRIVWFVVTPVAIWHFALVMTKLKK
jgi:hypothetical protein